jgi:hypothetical protein
MSYKVKIKIDTDSDFVLKFGHPNTKYKYKSVGGRIRCTLYYDKTEEQVIQDLITFLMSLDIITRKEDLENTYDENVYKYVEQLDKKGLHSNHNLLSGNYNMEVLISQEYSEYL